MKQKHFSKFKTTIMKKFIILMLLTWFVSVSFGQKKTTINKIYLQSGLGGSSYKGFSGETSIQAVFKNKWVGTISRQTFEMDPKNLPSNYQPETGSILFLPYSYTPDVEMKITSLTGGRFFKTGKKTWATLEAGPSFVAGEKVSFQKAQVTSTNIIIAASTSSNYTDTKENKNALGLALKADFNWSFASFAGLGAGVYANLNSIQSPVGFELKISLGWMNYKSKRS